MTENQDGERPVTMPSSGLDWQQWVAGADWSDWRSWLQRLAATDWAATDWAATDWAGTDGAATDWAAKQWTGTPWQAAPGAGPIPLTLRAFTEAEPGGEIRSHLAATWPAFRQWWQGGANTRPSTRRPGLGSRSTCRNSFRLGSG